ncbi:F-type H+-transporting ATPase subunit f [Metschnikowia aff. pulcherrima]|uniref:F-type H+-transporting ATPase subunit f n=1 Tax=Metschnikowia aff. pulcherrima TaxID=2163413 RepID=A0A4P6XQ83_9ASCO|nr:F-type H+-transporting ATPase subunit f [Metschnikowia aff. pulcherrima]
MDCSFTIILSITPVFCLPNNTPIHPRNPPQSKPSSNTNLQNIGSNPNAKRMAEVVSFYKKLPTGPAPAAKKSFSPWGKYRAAYIDGDNASGKPLLHLAIFIIVAGYTWEYQAHLKHHKDH